MDGCEIPLSYYKPSHKQDEGKMKTVPPRPVPNSLNESSLIWGDEVSVRHVRVILVEMLVRLESLLSGNSVAESVYTCLYAHNTMLHDMEDKLKVHGNTNDNGEKAVLQRTLFAGALLLLKLSEIIRRIVKRADIYEEEDFTINLYDFDFYPSFSSEQILIEVEVTRVALKNLVKEESESSEREDVKVILHGLAFMCNLFEACLTLTSLSKDNVMQNAQYLKEKVCTGVKAMQELIAITKDTEYSKADDETIFRTFDPYVNRHLLGNAPVRHVTFSPPEKAMVALCGIYEEMSSGVCNLLLRADTLARLYRMLSKISTSSYNVLSRSLIVINLYFDDMLFGRHVLPMLIANHMHRCAVPETITDTLYGRQFLNRLCKPIYDTLKLLTLNRNRQRTYMDVVMLKEWATLQHEAATVDLGFQDEFELDRATTMLYATNYVLLTTVGLMEYHVGLGIELGLFNGHYHLTTAFWYRDFLLSTRLNIITSMKEHLKERKAMEAQIGREEAAAKAKAENVNVKKKGKKGGKRNNATKSANVVMLVETSPEDEEDMAEFLLLSVKRTLCRGIVRVSPDLL